jgi:hypothetical protein
MHKHLTFNVSCHNIRIQRRGRRVCLWPPLLSIRLTRKDKTHLQERPQHQNVTSMSSHLMYFSIHYLPSLCHSLLTCYFVQSSPQPQKPFSASRQSSSFSASIATGSTYPTSPLSTPSRVLRYPDLAGSTNTLGSSTSTMTFQTPCWRIGESTLPVLNREFPSLRHYCPSILRWRSPLP